MSDSKQERDRAEVPPAVSPSPAGIWPSLAEFGLHLAAVGSADARIVGPQAQVDRYIEACDQCTLRAMHRQLTSEIGNSAPSFEEWSGARNAGEPQLRALMERARS